MALFVNMLIQNNYFVISGYEFQLSFFIFTSSTTNSINLFSNIVWEYEVEYLSVCHVMSCHSLIINYNATRRTISVVLLDGAALEF